MKKPSEKQLAARAAFAEASKAKAAERKAAREAAEAAEAAIKAAAPPVEEVETVDPTKLCLFCGAFTNTKRFVNLQTIAVCEEHYYSTTIGQIAQKMKEQEFSL